MDVASGEPRLVSPTDFVSGKVALILRAEAGVALLCTVVAYRITEANWILFAILFFAPDLTMVGYAISSRIGAAVYNAGHTYVSPTILAFVGWSITDPLLYSLALIWAAHIGFDRLLGYGLKYPNAFGDTHLGRLRRRSSSIAE
jgi:hypothetical protein